jgi:isopropylmalate/homocitrate/citramalate synthase
MSEISFIDTTLRDGQQSLWALGMKTDAMLGAAHDMDRIGFESMEFFVSIMIKKVRPRTQGKSLDLAPRRNETLSPHSAAQPRRAARLRRDGEVTTGRR